MCFSNKQVIFIPAAGDKPAAIFVFLSFLVTYISIGSNKYYSASFLLYYIVPLREYILAFEAISNQKNDDWNKIISKLDLNTFLGEIRTLLKKDGVSAEIITLFRNREIHCGKGFQA